MARKKKNEVAATEGESVSREEVSAYLSDIAARIVESDRSYMHSAIALNQIMRLPNVAEVIDEDLKQQMKDLWVKIKSTGLHLSDPPMLFGVPDFSEANNSARKAADGEVEDDSEAIVIELRPNREDEKNSKRKQSREIDDDDDDFDDFDDDDDDDSDEEDSKI